MVPLVAILAWASIAASRAIPVAEAHVDARRVLVSWNGSLPPDASWQPAWDALEEARRLDPGNPVTPELMGKLAANRADDRSVLGQAPRLFRDSLLLRPGSPRTWANYVEAKYLAGDAAPAIEPALLIAMRLGKAEPHAQRVVANYGLALWDEVTPTTRAAIDATLAAGIRRNPLEMLQIADRRGRLSVACRHLSGTTRQPDPQALRICQSRETSK